MTKPIHLEFDLAFLIARCGVTNESALRRLNGIENTVAALARCWRDPAPILPADELRMAETTRQRMIGWVTAETQRSEAVNARLAPYTSGVVCDAGVPSGWIRLCLSEPTPSTAGRG